MTDDINARKGRPTPSRRDAEAARKKAMRTPVSRKDQVRRERAARAELRAKQQESLRTGDEKYLPPRDRGPVRGFARDFIDRRWNVAEFLLPVLLVALVMSFVPTSWALFVQTYLWSFMIITTLADELLMVRRFKRELKVRFPETPTKGATGYAVLRSMQLRRFRLPKVRVARGEVLPDRY